AEAHSFALHHPIDHRSAAAACAQAVPQVLSGRDDQRGLVVGLERAETDEVRALLAQLDAATAYQGGEIDLALQSIDLLVRDARHQASCRKRVKRILMRFRYVRCRFN